MSTCLIINTDSDFVVQIGDKVIHCYSELYYENPNLLESHLRNAKILNVTQWSDSNKSVKSTDVHTADYFLDYLKMAADALAKGENLKVGGNQTVSLIL